MIQGSINQLLSVAGIAGGYASKLRSDALKTKIDDISASADLAREEGVQDYKEGNVERSLNMQEAEANEIENIDKIAGRKFTNPIGVSNYAHGKSTELSYKNMKAYAMANAAEAVEAQQELANNSFVAKKVWTPGEIRKDNEAKRSAQEKFEDEQAKKKGFAERDLGI